MITAGRVSVNGKTVKELGTKVDPGKDDVRVDGEPVLLDIPGKPVYIMLNKPTGVVCTASDVHAERTVMDLVSQVEERIYPVGRLDEDTSGLLLMTNDGDFANRLTHPRYHVPKLYRVRARGFVPREVAIQITEGVDLPDGKTLPAEVKFVDFDTATQCSILDITLYEGRNRQVRRMMDAVGHPVRELARIAYGTLKLQGLNVGTWRKLRPDEVAGLLALAQPTPTPKKSARPPRPPHYRPPKPVLAEEDAPEQTK